MLVSLNWLREFVEIEETPEALARRLTMGGLSVERIEGGRSLPDGLVIARILETRKHPGADRLTLCSVDAGDGTPRQVVCGAPNARAGLLGILALPGATLPNGLTLKKSKIRGEVSEGMLCAEDELGLGEDHTGIIELADGTPGRPATDAIPSRPITLEIDVTANRGDCMSHLGVAREIAALTGRALRRPPVALSESGAPIDAEWRAAVESGEDCPRYMARLVRGVHIGPSPAWLAARLEELGQRSINNVVDVTNLVLLERGQPLHAFDADRVGTGAIGVRRARAGERLGTLDGVERTLEPEILVITDGDRPIALAGVMGGRETEVHDGTTNILLEGAVFHPGRILRGSRRLRLDTEAAIRFRRGVDPLGTADALDRAAALIAELGGGAVAPGRIDRTAPALGEPKGIGLRPERVRDLLGEPVGTDEIRAALGAFGFTVAGGDDGAPLRVTVPSWRLDVLEECDLVEEVARRRGYDAIGVRHHNASAVNAPLQEDELRMRRVSEVMRGLGYDEAMTHNLVDPRRAVAAGLDAADVEAAVFRIADPPSREVEAMRVSLLPGLLESVGHNLRHGRPDVRLFELGKVFTRAASGPPAETVCVGLAASGGEFGPSRERSDRAYDFTAFRGAIEALAEAFGVGAIIWRDGGSAPLRPAAAWEAVSGGAPVGFAWEATGAVREAYDLKRPVYVAQIALDALRRPDAGPVQYREPSRYPSIRRDLALIVPGDLTHAEVRDLVRGRAGSFLETVELFDYYRGKHIPEGHVGLGFSLTFRAPDRTLAESEADGAVEAVVRGLGERGVTRRDR